MLPEKFSLEGIPHHFDERTGICRQIEAKPFIYDADYIQKSHKDVNFRENSERLSYLRLGCLLGALGLIPEKLIDVGYGNGDFLRACKKIIPHVVGFDIEPAFPIPGIQVTSNIYTEDYTVACFFDSLEHFVDPYEIQNLKAEYIFVSVPCFHPHLGLSWFETWRHKKPNEHLWYFSREGLVKFFSQIGFSLLMLSSFEDTIRQNREQEQANILSGIFQKKKS